MSLPAVSKHLKVLERAGLIARGREAQWRPCRLDASRSRRSRIGRSSTGASGVRASIGSTTICASSSQAIRKGKDMVASEVGSTVDREIVTSRVFDAPRELVFKAWSDPDPLRQWWGPASPTRLRTRLAGGVWRYVMHGPDGTDYKNESVFVESRSPSGSFSTTCRDRDFAGPPLRGSRRKDEDHLSAALRVHRRLRQGQAGRCPRKRGEPRQAREASRHARSDRRELTITRVFERAARARLEGLDRSRAPSPDGGGRRVSSILAVRWSCGREALSAWTCKAPTGHHPMTGIFHEIIEPERLFFTTSAHADEKAIPAYQVLNTVSFAERNGKTIVHAAGSPWPSRPPR